MVCVPCIFLPILLGIYLKFIQPIILRFVPERWKTTLDSILYPTCPINIQQQEQEQPTKPNQEDGCCKDENNITTCTKEENKKDI